MGAMSRAAAAGWSAYRAGETIGEPGSEGGVIIRDEEHADGARATLERKDGLFAVTCGVYGAMVHTCYLASDEAKALSRYEDLLEELAALVAADEPDYAGFVGRW